MMATSTSSNAVNEDKLPSRLVHLFTALSYICVALAFSYLDRRYGFFSVESMFWVVWGSLGFAAGAHALDRSAEAGKAFSLILSLVAALLAMFPAFFMYPLLRWVGVVLMLVVAARGPIMRTRRDLYLCLTVCFAVSFMVATHSMANWTLWLYLGPAWVFAGLALAWEYASSRAIGNWTKLGMSLGFIAMSTLMALVLFLFVPRPPVLGFGFIPPAADAPGLFDQPAGGTPGTGKEPGKSTGSGPGNAAGAANAPGAGADAGWRGQWQGMLEKMRPGSRDPTMPKWQRDLLGKLLDWTQALSGAPIEQSSDAATGSAEAERTQQWNLWSWLGMVLMTLLALALAWLAYRHRYWLGIELMHFGAWSLAAHLPLLSMRMSAKAMKWCLMNAGHAGKPGQSVREYLATAPAMPQLSRRWFGYAVDLYCETRFGPVSATPARASNMQRAVSAATQLVRGHAPELATP